MAKKDYTCPINCQEKHSTTKEAIAVINNKLDNIEGKLDTAIDEFKKVSEQKADKEEVNDLKNKYWIAVTGVIGLLLTIIFILLKHSGG